MTKSFRIASIVGSILLTQQSFAMVVERRSLDDISQFIDKNTLVIFDIDNTLIATAQSLGSSEWFYQDYLSHLREGMSEEKAKLTAQKEWVDINEASPTQSVEPGTAAFVQNLQKNGIHVMGLTARQTGIYTLTKRQLDSQNIDLEKTAFANRTDVELAKNVRYTHGILFVDEQNKGVALVKFLNHFHLSPQKIVFVDDVPKNTQDVNTALTNADIHSVNVRYSATDAKVQAYDPEIADVEWKIFNQKHILVSDAEVKKILDQAALAP